MSNVTLRYINIQKRKFDNNIILGKCFYSLTERIQKRHAIACFFCISVLEILVGRDNLF